MSAIHEFAQPCEAGQSHESENIFCEFAGKNRVSSPSTHQNRVKQQKTKE
jgi:hypothetical protein